MKSVLYCALIATITMAQKRSKNQIRRDRAKLRKVVDSNGKSPEDSESKVSEEKDSQKVVELVELLVASEPSEAQENNEDDEDSKTTFQRIESIFPSKYNSLASQYADIFNKFDGQVEKQTQVQRYQEVSSESEYDTDLESDSEKPLSKRQRRKLEKIPIAELKAATNYPQLVEWHDPDGPDPFMVVTLKSMPNYVDAPSHWQQKKDYLSSKRSSEKPPYRLPKFIYDTGIAEMRNHDPESLKKLQRDRIQPKMGKLDIDYQKLHDAFYKHQTKPKLLAFGELYYEGREKSDQYREEVAQMRPGKISRTLRSAVGMPENESAEPPWTTLMRELGKPPAYENCVVPGVDVAYNNKGYTFKDSDNWGKLDLLQNTWGELEEGEDSAEEVLESEQESEEDVHEREVEPEEEVDAESSEEDQPAKVDITEYSRVKTVPTQVTSSLGQLYTVLKEKSGDGEAYEINLAEGLVVEPPQEKKAPAPSAETFKF